MHRLAGTMYTEKAVGLLLSAPTQSRSLQWSLSTGHSTTSTGCRQPSSRQWRQLRGPAPFTGRSLSTESCCQLGTGASSLMRSPAWQTLIDEHVSVHGADRMDRRALRSAQPNPPHITNRILYKTAWADLSRRPVQGNGVCSDSNRTAQRLQME